MTEVRLEKLFNSNDDFKNQLSYEKVDYSIRGRRFCIEGKNHQKQYLRFDDVVVLTKQLSEEDQKASYEKLKWMQNEGKKGGVDHQQKFEKTNWLIRQVTFFLRWIHSNSKTTKETTDYMNSLRRLVEASAAQRPQPVQQQTATTASQPKQTASETTSSTPSKEEQVEKPSIVFSQVEKGKPLSSLKTETLTAPTTMRMNVPTADIKKKLEDLRKLMNAGQITVGECFVLKDALTFAISNKNQTDRMTKYPECLFKIGLRPGEKYPLFTDQPSGADFRTLETTKLKQSERDAIYEVLASLEIAHQDPSQVARLTHAMNYLIQVVKDAKTSLEESGEKVPSPILSQEEQNKFLNSLGVGNQAQQSTASSSQEEQDLLLESLMGDLSPAQTEAKKAGAEGYKLEQAVQKLSERVKQDKVVLPNCVIRRTDHFTISNKNTEDSVPNSLCVVVSYSLDLQMTKLNIYPPGKEPISKQMTSLNQAERDAVHGLIAAINAALDDPLKSAQVNTAMNRLENLFTEKSGESTLKALQTLNDRIQTGTLQVFPKCEVRKPSILSILNQNAVDDAASRQIILDYTSAGRALLQTSKGVKDVTALSQPEREAVDGLIAAINNAIDAPVKEAPAKGEQVGKAMEKLEEVLFGLPV